VIAADSSRKGTYPYATIFLILSSSLPASFKLLTRRFIAQPTLSNPEKIDMVVEHEMDIRTKETKTERAYIAKSSAKVSKYLHQHSDSNSEEGSSIKCHFCDGDHAFQFCNHVKLAGKLLKQYLCKQKYLEGSDKKASSWSHSRKPSRKTHGYKATASSSDDNSETSLNSTSSDDNDGILEVCNLSHDNISKATLFSWPADTGASSTCLINLQSLDE
jgi:hypothetical protein